MLPRPCRPASLPILQLGKGIPRSGIYAVKDDKSTREQFYYAGER